MFPFDLKKKKTKSLLPFKPFSKSSISGDLPHPLYFTRTMCPQVSFKPGALRRDSRMVWESRGSLVAFLLFSSWSVGFHALLCSSERFVLLSPFQSVLEIFLSLKLSPTLFTLSKGVSFGKVVLNYLPHNPLADYTNPGQSKRERPRENWKPRLMVSHNKNFCCHKVVFYLGCSSLEKTWSYVFLVLAWNVGASVIFSLVKQQ